MKNLKETIEGFAFPFLEYLIDLFDRERENATLCGFPCKIDEGGFAIGTLIKCSVKLYLKESSPIRAEQLRQRLLRFLDMINEDSNIGTWGKQFLLEALNRLKDAGKLDIISPEKLELLNCKTDYSDFFDKKTVTIPSSEGKPTNYYHVAQCIATYRELLGFENEGMSGKIADKLINIMLENSDTGWMDEVPPRGRFDSYSLASYRNVYEALSVAGKDIPEFIMKNAKESVLINLSAKNRHGYGFMYGRSLSVYGESGTLGQLIFGFKSGFIDESDRDEAIAYCIHLCERLISFWYRKDKKSFDIWTDSRSTDCYRSPDVILNLNLEICERLVSVLEYFESIGLDTYVPMIDISLPEKWEARKTEFVKEKGKVRSLYVLRRGSHSFMLPFVGMSDKPSTVNDAYFAFPHEPEFIEEPVWRYHPFLVPEVVLEDGTVAVLMEGFEEINEKYEDDKVTINVTGKLVGRDTSPTDVGFDGEYVFSGDKIKVRFNIHKPYNSAKMIFSGAKTDHVRFFGSEREEISDVSSDKEYFACCGGIKECKTAYFKNEIGYEIML